MTFPFSASLLSYAGEKRENITHSLTDLSRILIVSLASNTTVVTHVYKDDVVLLFIRLG